MVLCMFLCGCSDVFVLVCVCVNVCVSPIIPTLTRQRLRWTLNVPCLIMKSVYSRSLLPLSPLQYKRTEREKSGRLCDSTHLCFCHLTRIHHHFFTNSSLPSLLWWESTAYHKGEFYYLFACTCSHTCRDQYKLQLSSAHWIQLRLIHTNTHTGRKLHYQPPIGQ